MNYFTIAGDFKREEVLQGDFLRVPKTRNTATSVPPDFNRTSHMATTRPKQKQYNVLNSKTLMVNIVNVMILVQ